MRLGHECSKRVVSIATGGVWGREEGFVCSSCELLRLIWPGFGSWGTGRGHHIRERGGRHVENLSGRACEEGQAHSHWHDEPVQFRLAAVAGSIPACLRHSVTLFFSPRLSRCCCHCCRLNVIVPCVLPALVPTARSGTSRFLFLASLTLLQVPCLYRSQYISQYSSQYLPCRQPHLAGLVATFSLLRKIVYCQGFKPCRPISPSPLPLTPLQQLFQPSLWFYYK